MGCWIIILVCLWLRKVILKETNDVSYVMCAKLHAALLGFSGDYLAGDEKSWHGSGMCLERSQ